MFLRVLSLSLLRVEKTPVVKWLSCLPSIDLVNKLASGTGSIPVGCNLFRNFIALLKKRRESART